MDQYKISQNPSPNKKAPSRPGKAAAKKSKGPKSRQTQAMNPQLVLGGIVAALVLVLGGVVWARFVNKPNQGVASNNGQVVGKTAGQSGGTVIPGPTIEAVTDAVGNKDLGSLKNYYAKQVKVVILKSSFNRTVSAAEVENLINNPLNSAQTPWNWHVPPGDLSDWQSGPYGEYFQDGVLVGISEDGTVISIHFDDNGQIDTIFIAPVEDLTNPDSGGGSGGGQGSGSDTTPSDSGTPAVNPNGSD